MGWRNLLGAFSLAAALAMANWSAAQDTAPSEETGAADEAAASDDDHPHNDHKLPKLEPQQRPMPGTGGNKTDLASKLSNPTAPVMSLRNFLDVRVNGGSAPGAHRATLGYTFQPAFPFPTKRGNVIIRPLIPVDFGAPYFTETGTVQTATGFGNIQMLTVWGKTIKIKNGGGIMAMGGFDVGFPSATKKELRADWSLGPSVVFGYVVPKKQHMFGTIQNFNWNFPRRERGQLVSGQYFYAFNVGDGWQVAAQPVWSYSREAKVLRFPIGTGVQKVAALGKKNKPVLFGVQIWGYAPPPGASGPEWTIRFQIAPVVPLPWKK